MEEEGKRLFTVSEAAATWGITKQAVYQRLNKLNKQGFIVEQAKKRYITREGLESFNQQFNQVEQDVEQAKPIIQPTFNQLEQEVESLKTQLQQAREELLEEKGRTNTLQATIDAQKAHLDSLQSALDREQSLHMTMLQQRLPAPRKGFMEWLRGTKKDG